MSVFGLLLRFGVERRCLLLLSFVFAVISFAIGLNALLRAKRERSYINRLLAPHGIIDIGIHDVFTSGAVITAICALLAVLSGIFCVATWCPIKHKAYFFRYQSWTLFLCAAWLFATLVTYDYFFANRSIPTTIDLHGLLVPEAVIQRIANVLDFTHAYRDVYYWRLLAVVPWFAFGLAAVAGVGLQISASRACAFASNTKQDGERNYHVRPQVQP